MADMHDAFDIARAIDGRLELAGAEVEEEAVGSYREALYDYRGDGDLDAFLERCAELLAQVGGDAGVTPVEGRCFRALDSVFSSG